MFHRQPTIILQTPSFFFKNILKDQKVLSNFRFEIIIGFCLRENREETKKCFEPMI